ncbi:single-stranded-DNA-specific exonuclease RecJ [Radiobacillus kanasensis]|uniref:single-stranded-DNA-specific exonuclease RecJ n=1 Tax=Radiobacillus kanasensis TaxID=2844358 RepID=UPI001E2EA7B4|nr:single-stranded-DNA-specific exonuclease RecJ [Radiobacillus kanasensis]UFT97886.1 single-stranded-DNA-specific exonuclease RecJ [Radiobacillus kanasensis]
MLQSQAKWNFTYDQHQIGFEHNLNISPWTEQLLRQRNVKTEAEADAFLHPQLSQLHDPGLLHDIDLAVERVKQAIENEEKILVFGDYDADGVSSTSVMMEALRELGASCDFYIPNRFTEGYGPNEKAFQEAKENGFSLIITVDTGIAAVYEAEVAKQLGLDLIITDHHEVQEELPDAYAIVHPKCSENYPFHELAGVGVAFKFAEHLLGYFPKQLLDLVVIGTIADLVPLVDENRVLAYYGLQAISRTKRPGLIALKDICKIDSVVNEEDIGFLIGPRINAVGRLQDASMAVDLLLTDDLEQARELSDFIQQLNQERQKIVSDIAKEAQAMVENESPGDNSHVIVVAKEGWNEGVLGIVASKLVRQYDRPAVVLSINSSTGKAKGSARSIDAFDLFSSCMTVRNLFNHFGGHAQAAGMTLDIEQIAPLRGALNKIAKEQLTDEDFKQVIRIEASLPIESIQIDLIKEISALAPFGMGNPKPLFHVQTKPREIKQIGSTSNHLKFTFEQDSHILDGVGFGMGNLFSRISPQAVVEAVGELSINEWNGSVKPQLMLKDIAVKEWQLFDYRGSNHWYKQLDKELEDPIAISFTDNTNIAKLPNGFDHFTFSDLPLAILEQKPYRHVVLLDLPRRLKDIESILEKLNPDVIYTCYRNGPNSTISILPTREEFKWLYAFVLKRKELRDSDIPKIATHKGWKVEKVQFMIQVFLELDFIKVVEKLITPCDSPLKKDLTEAPSYQAMKAQLEIESVLYYSSYAELKEWLENQINRLVPLKEEVTNGL